MQSERRVGDDKPLSYSVESRLVVTVALAIFGVCSIEQHTPVKALLFGTSLLAVLLTVLGILFVLVGLI